MSESNLVPKEIFALCNVELRDIGGQLRGDCPLCDKENHLFVNGNTGQWECKKCMESGNVYTFMRKWYDVCKESHDPSLTAKVRPGIGKITLAGADLGYDGDSWIIPSYQIRDGERKIKTLRRWTHNPKSIKTFKGTKSGVYIARWTDNPEAKVWVLEGEWDALAWLRIVDKVEEDDIILAVPGAGAFPERELSWVTGRKVYLVYDHDEPEERKGKLIRPGFDGMARTGPKFASLGASVLCCSWSRYQPEMDVRDLCILHWKDTDKVWNDINGMLVPLHEFRESFGYEKGSSSSSTEKDEIPDYVESFEEVMDEFETLYEVTEMFERCVACAFATLISNRFDGDQLWMFLVGPPSSGKTTIIEAFGKAHKYTHHISKLTSQGLVSGKNNGDSDPSILSRIRDKCMFVKDFTAVLALPPGVQEELFGMLRDAYDRNVRVEYGNGTTRHYTDLNFTVFAGCTDEIYTKNHSSLGERFLKVEILDPSFSPTAQARAALMGLNNKFDTTRLKKVVYGYCRYLWEKAEPETSVDDDTIDWLVSVATIVSYLRTSVRRTSGDMAYRPRPEVPARLSVQLRKLYLTLKMVCPEKDEQWLKLTVEKVAMDSCVGWALEFILPILARKDGITSHEIAEICQVSTNHVTKVLRDLQQIGILDLYHAPNNSGRAGRPSNQWVPNATFLELWEEADIEMKATKKFTPSRRAKRSKKGTKA